MKILNHNPQHIKTLIIGLGLEEWDNSDDPIGHRDIILHDFFKKQGVPDNQNIHFRNEKGTKKNLENFLPEFLANSDGNTFFIFYYAGHGQIVSDDKFDLSFCHPTQKSFTFRKLIRLIKEIFKGNYGLFMADCCYSGNMARYCANYKGKYNFAGLTSSQYNKGSTSAWTFTDCILEGLQGNKMLDTNEDNVISLQELANYVQIQMQKIDKQKSDFGYSANFDANIPLIELNYSA